MKRFRAFFNYDPEKAGRVALFAFVISLIFKGRKKDGKHKNIFIRFVRNFTRVSSVVGLVSMLDAKNAMENKKDGIDFEEAAEMYNKSVGENVIDIEYDENGNVKGTGKCTKTYNDIDQMTE